MNTKIKFLFLKDPSNWKFWFALALLFKGILFFFKIIQGSDQFSIHNFIGNVNVDSFSYLNPIENLLKSGHYGDAIRTPGYGVIYLIFRLFCSQGMACNLLIFSQYILASISVYYLAKTIRLITNNTQLFYWVFYLFLLSSYSNYLDDSLMTESFCASALVLGTYFFVNYLINIQLSHLFFSGVLVTWAIFLRPVFISVLFFYLFVIFFHQRKSKLFLIKASLVFISSFLIFDGIWIIRNYSIYKKTIPLTGSVWGMFNNEEWKYSAVYFIQSWGGNYEPGSDKSILYWFGFKNHVDNTKYEGVADPFPQYIYTTKFNKDSLLTLKENFSSLEDTSIYKSDTEKEIQGKILENHFNEYAHSIRDEKPFLFYIRAPLIYLKEFLTFKWASYNVIGYSSYHSGILNYFNNLNYVVIKWFKMNPINWVYMVFNYIMLILGFLGILLLIKRSFKQPLLLTIWIIPAYIIIIHPVILRLMINRYLMPAWPFILVSAAYFIVYIKDKIRKIEKH